MVVSLLPYMPLNRCTAGRSRRDLLGCNRRRSWVLYVKRAFGEDCKNKRQYLKETKTNRIRGIQLNGSALEALRKMRAIQAAFELAAKPGQYANPQGFVFTDRYGNPIRLDLATKN